MSAIMASSCSSSSSVAPAPVPAPPPLTRHADPHHPRELIIRMIEQRLASSDPRINIDSIVYHRPLIVFPSLPQLSQPIQALVVIPQLPPPATYPPSFAHSSRTPFPMTISATASNFSSSLWPLTPHDSPSSSESSAAAAAAMRASPRIEEVRTSKKLTLCTEESKSGLIQLVLESDEMALLVDAGVYTHDTLFKWLDELSPVDFNSIAIELRVFGDFAAPNKDKRGRPRKTTRGQCYRMIDSDLKSRALRPQSLLTELILNELRSDATLGPFLLGVKPVSTENLSCIHDQFGQEIYIKENKKSQQKQPSNAQSVQQWKETYQDHTGLYELCTRYLVPSNMTSTAIVVKGETPSVPQSLTYLQDCLRNQKGFDMKHQRNYTSALDLWCKLADTTPKTNKRKFDAASSTSAVAAAASASSSSNSSAQPIAATSTAPLVDIATFSSLALKDGMAVPREPSSNPAEFVQQFVLANMMVDHLNRIAFRGWLAQSFSIISQSSMSHPSITTIPAAAAPAVSSSAITLAPPRATSPPITSSSMMSAAAASEVDYPHRDKKQRVDELPSSASLSSNWMPGAPAAASLSSVELRPFDSSHSISSHDSNSESHHATMAPMEDDSASLQPAHLFHSPLMLPTGSPPPPSLLGSPSLTSCVHLLNSATSPPSPLSPLFLGSEARGSL